MMTDVIKKYVDSSLSFMEKHKEYLMYLDHCCSSLYESEINLDMQGDFDYSHYSTSSPTVKLLQNGTNSSIARLISENSKSWKAIDADIDDTEIEELEKYFSIELPNDYKEYLKYKFFYQIYWNLDIKLFPKPKKMWSNILISFNEKCKDDILAKGLFCIGEFSDYGIISINLSNNNIVFVDCETGDYSKVIAVDFTNFLSFALESEEPILKELSSAEKKMKIYE